MARYRALVGIDFDSDGEHVRLEPGDVTARLPEASVPWLLAQGAIAATGEAPTDVPATAEPVEVPAQAPATVMVAVPAAEVSAVESLLRAAPEAVAPEATPAVSPAEPVSTVQGL